LIAKVQACNLRKVQLALSPLLKEPRKWSNAGRKLHDAGIEIVSGMIGCIGEDYTSIARIRLTGGVMPDDTYPATLHHMRSAAPLAAELGIKLLTFHAGFIPREPDSATFKKGLARVAESAKVFADAGVEVALETGQEPADVLLAFLGAFKPATVDVNFDPANMLLYGSGDPIAALEKLLPHIRQVHIKDAVASNTPGEWGREVVAGTGQVDWRRFFNLLRSRRLAWVIEREAGTSRIADVMTAVNLITRWIGRPDESWNES
jgi:L-ribulose-5-phosphate 3-epimerase